MTITQEKAEAHTRSFKLDGGFVYPQDPLTGRPISVNSVPESIARNEQLRSGLEFIASSDIKLALYGVRHGESDLFDEAELRSLIDSSSAIFLEGLGHEALHRGLVYDLADPGAGVKVVDMAQVNVSGNDQQFRAIEDSGKPAFFADIPSDGETDIAKLFEFQSIEEDLVEMMKNLNKDQDVKGVRLARGINLAIGTLIRDWHMIASMGHNLKSISDAGLDYSSPLLIIGGIHLDTLRPKLDALKVDYTTRQARQVERQSSVEKVSVPFDFRALASGSPVRLE